jgi:hypothetical protein
MELDLSHNSSLSIEHCKYLSKIEKKTVIEYNNYISKIIEINNIQGMGWFNSVISRNIHLSSLLDNFCKIRLLQYVLSSNTTIKTIRVDSVGMYRVLQRIVCSMGYKATVKLSPDKRFNFLPFINLIKSCFKLLNLFIWPKLLRGKIKPFGKIIFLDTFLFIDSFGSNNEYHDRYYPGIEDSIKDIKLLWYSPTLIGINSPSRFYRIFKAIRTSSKQFLMKEDWLKILDYFSAIYLSYSLTRIVKLIPLWDGINIEELINEETKKDIFSMNIINPILIYFFIKRLKLLNVNIDLVIDWHENQVIDRALILGVRDFYSGTKIHGYQGYVVSDYNAGKDPITLEYESGILPDELFVVGQKFVEDKKKYCPNLPVSVAEAFRFSEIHKINLSSKNPSNKILLLLPISIKEGKEIINMGLNLISLIGSEYDFYLKQHPSLSKDKLFKTFPQIQDSSLNIIQKDLYRQLLESALLISSSSSVCLEASLMGIKVAIVGSRTGPAMNPLANLTDLKNWQVCYSEHDVIDLISKPNIKLDIAIEDYLSSVKCHRLINYSNCK